MRLASLAALVLVACGPLEPAYNPPTVSWLPCRIDRPGAHGGVICDGGDDYVYCAAPDGGVLRTPEGEVSCPANCTRLRNLVCDGRPTSEWDSP